MSSECLFCKIIKGEIPSYKVFEDDYVLAFLDIHPHAKGHTVVVPKKHFEVLGELEKEEWGKVLEGVRLALNKIQKVLNPQGINIAINDRPTAGQVVPHVHWHIFPRYNGDGGASAHAIVNNAGDTPVEQVANLF